MTEEDPLMEDLSRLEDIKYYTSIFLGTLAILSVFVLLLLVPLVLLPAISTLLYHPVEAPVHCKVAAGTMPSC